jgi:molybdopterin/thiamine biosynthesis adenylyltransferase
LSLDDFSDFVAHSRQHFEEGLIRAGFIERDAGWIGFIGHRDGPTEVTLTLPSRFPFKPPRVVPTDNDAVPWSWHRELNGALCLVADDDHQDLWWLEADAFLKHVAAWFENSDAGWVDDRPDLDLDRYFTPAEDTSLYLYGDLDEYRNSLVRFVRAPNNTMRLAGKGTRPAKVAKVHLNDVFGYVADLGDVVSPPRTWEDVAALVEPSVDLERRIREHSIRLLVLLYNRGSHEGAIVLEVWPSTAGGIEVRRLRAGADTAAAKSARSGPRSVDLNPLRVAVVGVGALGSFIADMLIRAGVGHLTLIDGDVVMPGNLVRHLVGPEAVGLPKATAVKNHLVRNHGIDPSRIDAQVEAVRAGDAAVDLLRDHDLVVNATADFAITALFHKAAEALGKSFLSAALQNDGNTFRIDVLPPLAGGTSLSDSARSANKPAVTYFEAGCGSPISPTPPHAVIEAAAATVRHAVGLLLNEPVDPSGEVRDLVPETVPTT